MEFDKIKQIVVGKDYIGIDSDKGSHAYKFQECNIIFTDTVQMVFKNGMIQLRSD